MGNFLRDRFPLGDTSTVYMTGKALYTLVRWGKPGLIATVELYPGDAKEFRAAVREAQAEAWDKGLAVGDAYGADAASLNPMHRNPYR